MAHAQVPSSTFLPTAQVSHIPSQDDFLSKSQSDLLQNYPHYTVQRQNGEKVDSYFLYDNTKKDFVMIFYFEDKTNSVLQNYFPFNSDYFGLFLKSDVTQERYIFAERNGNGCMFPVQHLDDYWAGKFSGCEGGATIVKKTNNGWAVYVKFFKDVPNPLTEKDMIRWGYGDIQTVQDNVVKKIEYDNWPQTDYARLALVPEVKPPMLVANSGKINIADFLYTPSNILTTGLQKNTFSCANDIIRVSTDLTNYNSTYHVARITASLNSEIQPSTLYLKIYNDQDDVVLKDSQQWSGDKDALFLSDLGNFKDGVYSAVVQYGTNGPQTTIKFAVGKSLVQNQNEGCYFYLVYDKTTRNLSFLVNIKDTTSSPNDGLQIFVDRNGNDVNNLNSDDVSYIVQQTRFGATVIESNGMWLQDSQHEKTGDGRFKILPKSYQVLINIPNVSENFRFALEQTDNGPDGVKTSRYPFGSFSTVPSTWSAISIGNASPPALVSNKWEPDEIVAKQTVNVNLILVGDSWNSTLKDKILHQLDSSYSPIISSEMARAGIQYDYNYNFISASDKSASDLFSFMKSQATDVRPFYGENDFKSPWGIALWIQNNHTEWVDNFQSNYKVNYKLIDADKMEEYIQSNIISSNPSLSQPNSANLVFLADGLNKINFLHNYKLQRYDSASNAGHNAVGLMGYGGKYNFYFFDLYAVPWSETFENPPVYDKKLASFATDLLDIKSEDGYARLVSDYTNNATNLLITPSYIYPPVYKKHYTLDLMIIHKPSGNIGSLNSIIDFYIDKNKIKSELESLIPYSNWDIKVTLANSISSDLPDNVKQAINDIKTVTPFQDLPSYTVDILNSQSVAKAVAQWPTTSKLINSQEFENLAASSWDIPAITIVSSIDRPIYIDFILEDGVATANLNDPTQPCCAIGVTDGNTVWTQKVSATRLVMHEVGHTLGLMHPFMGYSADGKFFQNNYFNWYDSIMAYNAPPYGCGIWYTNYVSVTDPIDKTCGISDTIFTKFEKDNLSRGVTSYIIKTTETNVYMTMLNLELSGHDPNNIQGDLKNTISGIESKLDKAKNAFMQNDILSADGAMNNALAAALESGDLAKSSGVNYQNSTPQVKDLQIPSWVKSTAKWWSQGQIDDSEFVKGIQYLIQQGIMKIPQTNPSSSSSNGIPTWIKNNAGWWADGQLSDAEFVKGIQYLIQIGIIKV